MILYPININIIPLNHQTTKEHQNKSRKITLCNVCQDNKPGALCIVHGYHEHPELRTETSLLIGEFWCFSALVAKLTLPAHQHNISLFLYSIQFY
jgi:hypothetical protein